MIQFKTTLQRFEKQGEKTGWTYITISQEQVAALNPASKVSFRVKGKLDSYAIEKVALMPMGDGSYIMAINATMRKAIKKQKGDAITVQLEVDREPIQIDSDFIACLNDEPKALKTFGSLTKGHQNYFSKWIESAKTESTKAKRIGMAVNALALGRGYTEMMREHKRTKQELGF